MAEQFRLKPFSASQVLLRVRTTHYVLLRILLYIYGYIIVVEHNNNNNKTNAYNHY